jgi:mannosyl-3-phosphoglycerate phosphatase
MKIIFTDLDGTLLDKDTYSFDEAKPALKLVKQKRIPIILTTSKTRAEVEVYNKKLGISHPFICENGGGIFIPKDYFKVGFEYTSEEDGYCVIRLGEPYKRLREVLNQVKKAGINVKGFGDMSIDEICRITNLPREEAVLAKQREFTEPFMLEKEEDEKKVFNIIERNGLRHTKGGRFYHITGNNDKGKAVRILTGLYRKEYADVVTYGIGDAENDFAMLDNVDNAFLVQRKDGNYTSEKYGKAKGIGPEGWNSLVLSLL